MAQFFISMQAYEDLQEIVDYLAMQSGSFDVAQKFISELDSKLIQYARQPEMGTIRNELRRGLRCFTFKKNYVVYYLVRPSGIEVARLLHGSRDVEGFFI